MARSEKEKDWLERRAANEMAFDAFFCPHCEQFNVERDPYLGHCDDDSRCPLTEHDFRDAAEFEARVAEQLVRHTCFNCPASPEDCPTFFEHPRRTSKDCRLKRARLAAEAEMDRKS